MSALKKIAIATLLSGLQTTVVFADGPPKLTVTTTCNGAAQLLGRDKAACLEDEIKAQKTIAQGWSKYRADHKTRCVATVQIGGVPSYVELLSCLETMRDSKDFRHDDGIMVEVDQSKQLTSRPDEWGPDGLPLTEEPLAAPQPGKP